MGITVRGADTLTQAVRAMGERAQAATPAAVMAATAILRQQVRTELSRTSHAPGTPTPSGPGEPPSLITGHLRDSVTVVGPTGGGTGRYITVTGPTAEYARVQELGGATGRNHATTLPARPYLRPAYDTTVHNPRFLEAFARVWGQAIRT